MEVERESMDYDVVVVGAGPSGLSTAIKLKQLKPEINVCVFSRIMCVFFKKMKNHLNKNK